MVDEIPVIIKSGSESYKQTQHIRALFVIWSPWIMITGSTIPSRVDNV